MVLYLLSRIQRRLWGLEAGEQIAAPLPVDIQKLGVEGAKRIWRDAKPRGTGMRRAKTLVSAAEHGRKAERSLSYR